MATPDVLWSIVVPVKRLPTAKTRLAVPPGLRADVALAMALDTVAAALAAGRVGAVVAVTDDERAQARLTALGARVVADEPDAGLNPALEHGARQAAATGAGRIGALASDLPALRPTDLDATLAAADKVARGAVADAAGSGTTLFTAGDLAQFAPEFGAASWARHLAAGAVDLTDTAGASLRRDVDTLGDLQAALRLGCGPHTHRLVEQHPSLRGAP